MVCREGTSCQRSPRAQLVGQRRGRIFDGGIHDTDPTCPSPPPPSCICKSHQFQSASVNDFAELEPLAVRQTLLITHHHQKSTSMSDNSFQLSRQSGCP